MSTEVTLMYIEVMYLWRALPFCSDQIKLRLLSMLDGCNMSNGIPFHHGLSALLKGCILSSMNKPVDAEISLNKAIGFEKTIKHDKHIMSFALYEMAMIHISKDEVRDHNTDKYMIMNYVLIT